MLGSQKLLGFSPCGVSLSYQGVRQPAKPTYQEWDSKLKNLCLDLQDSEIPDTLVILSGYR
jgi:hypothetical protein